MLRLKPEKGGRGKKSVKITEFAFDASYLSHARTVLAHTPDLANNVLTGSTSLDEAYRIARERKDAQRKKPCQAGGQPFWQGLKKQEVCTDHESTRISP